MSTKLSLALSLLLLTLFCSPSALEVEVKNLVPISISVTGDIARPGVYTLTTLNRLSEALEMADMIPTANLPLIQQPDISKEEIDNSKVPAQADTLIDVVYGWRNITLIRQGERQNNDLLQFFRLGDAEQNPYLRDGDVIVVNPVRSVVTLQGSVIKPGDYEFREGDSIRDLFDLALGVTDNAVLKNVMFYRYNDDFSEFTKSVLDLSGYPKTNDAVLNMALQPGDRIIVPLNSEFRKVNSVYVSGQVKMPGMYYVDDQTTLYDLLVMCGGPTEDADLQNSFVYNTLINESLDPDFARLKDFPYQQMTWLEYSYLRAQTRQLKGKYSVDVLRCWNSQGKEANLVLKDADKLHVPEQLNGVWVTGQVRNPGLVTWSKDMRWKDYLAAAGGYANNRNIRGIRIISAHSGNWTKPSDKEQINPGDVIFVPDKEERYTWDYVKDAILLTSQLLSILIAVRAF